MSKRTCTGAIGTQLIYSRAANQGLYRYLNYNRAKALDKIREFFMIGRVGTQLVTLGGYDEGLSAQQSTGSLIRTLIKNLVELSRAAMVRSLTGDCSSGSW